MVYAVSAVHRDSILRFARFQFPFWLLATAPRMSSSVLSSRSASVSLQDAPTSLYIRSVSALPIRENCLPSTLSIILFIAATFLAKRAITAARKYIFFAFIGFDKKFSG